MDINTYNSNFSEQLSPEIKFLLTNVVYFHDAWVGGSFDRLEEEFDPVPDFKLSNGGMSKPNWMQRSSQHFVLRNITIPSAGRELNFKAVSIPYEVSLYAVCTSKNIEILSWDRYSNFCLSYSTLSFWTI